MGWDPIGDLKKEVKKAARVVDNVVGTNISGKGPKNSLLNQAGRAVNRSDLGRYVGRSTRDLGNVVIQPIVATSDLLRGDTEQAGRSLGAGIGSAANLGTSGSSYLAQDNKSLYKDKRLSSATLGLSSDYADFSSAANSAVHQRNLTSDEIHGTARLGVKAGLIATGAYYMPQIKSGYAATTGFLSGTGKDLALIGSTAKAAQTGDVAGVINNIAPGLTDYIPQVPPTSPEFSDIFKDILDPSGSRGAPGNTSSYSTPNQASYASTVPLQEPEGSFSPVILLVLGALAIIAFKLIKK